MYALPVPTLTQPHRLVRVLYAIVAKYLSDAGWQEQFFQRQPQWHLNRVERSRYVYSSYICDVVFYVMLTMELSSEILNYWLCGGKLCFTSRKKGAGFRDGAKIWPRSVLTGSMYCFELYVCFCLARSRRKYCWLHTMSRFRRGDKWFNIIRTWQVSEATSGSQTFSVITEREKNILVQADIIFICFKYQSTLKQVKIKTWSRRLWLFINSFLSKYLIPLYINRKYQISKTYSFSFY